jgi:nucleotide-binding universal stress UspA family protein
MKTILVPTDFSKNAESALYYAIELAQKERAALVLLHAFTISYTNIFSPESELAEAKKKSDLELKKLGIKIEHARNIEYEFLSIEGSAVKVILETIKNKKIDLIVMGTKGASNFLNAIFGGNTSKVMAKAECPVIAIPEEASLKPVKKITYATDYKNGDLYALKKVLEIAKPFSAQINILHISTESESPLTEKKLMEKFMNEVNEQIAYFNLSFQMLHGNNIEEELRKYIEAQSADLLVMSSQHRAFFENIFKKSLDKKLAGKTDVPLMVFHFNKKLSEMLF